MGAYLEAAFDENQPRDEQGRWGSGGGASANPEASTSPRFRGHLAALRKEKWRPKEKDDKRAAFFFESQKDQYPKTGEPGLSYYKGEIDADSHVDCVLFRSDEGELQGVLNYFPKDFPPFERKGNINVLVSRNAKRQGIATKLLMEAGRRWPVNLKRQSYTAEGREFITHLLNRKPPKKFDPDQPRDEQGQWGSGGGGGKIPLSAEPSDSSIRQAQLSRVSKDDYGLLDDWGVSSASDYERKVNETLEQLVPNSRVFVRMNAGDLNSVLSSGEIQNAFQSGHSHGGTTARGDMDLGRRRYVEEKLFGIEEGAGGEARPKYGYLSSGDGISELSPRTLRGAGGVAVRLKDGLRERTSFTVGDSADHAVTLMPEGLGGGWVDNASFRPQPMLKPSMLAAPNGIVDKPDAQRVERLAIREYVEAQVHGKVRVGDIKSVTFAVKPGKAIAARLKRAGIPFTVARSKKDFRDDQPRDDDGRWSDGGGGSGGSKPRGRMSSRARRAMASYKPSTAKKHAHAEDSEREAARELGAARTDDNAPADMTARVGRTIHGFEVKTMVDNSNDKITMHPDSLARKMDWAKSNKARFHTVIVDKRNKTGHAAQWSGHRVYYREGAGSFRLGSMEKTSWEGIRQKLGLKKSYHDILLNAMGHTLMVDGFAMLQAGFDPDQPRDDHGRWGSGGADDRGGGTSKPPKVSAEHIAEVRGAIRAQAKEMGFPMNRIKIENYKRTFTSGGRTYTSGGRYTNGGDIVLNHDSVMKMDTAGVRGRVAHEITHDVFYNVGMADNQGAEEVKPFSDYMLANQQALRAKDGVTQYSQAHWEDAWDDDYFPSTESRAINETLAEISKVKIKDRLSGTKTKIDPVWEEAHKRLFAAHEALQSQRASR